MTEHKEQTEQLSVASSPHIAASESCTSIMLWVVAALAPAAIWSMISIGLPAVQVYVLCIGSVLGTEAAWNAIAKKPQTLLDEIGRAHV